MCGRDCCRAAPAGEQPRPGEKASVLLVCDSDLQELPNGYAQYVMDYHLTGRINSSCPVLTYSVQNDRADFTARNLRRTSDGLFAFEMVGIGVIGRVRLHVETENAVSAALAAASAAIAAGIPFAEVMNALNSIQIRD